MLKNQGSIKNKLKIEKYESFFNTEQLKEDLKQRAIRGGMITSASQGILFILRLASIMVLARMLIPEGFRVNRHGDLAHRTHRAIRGPRSW